MTWLWTWSGRSFGYRSGDALFTQDGRQVGRFHGEEVYAPSGRYLGEVKRHRLITSQSKKSLVKPGFTPTRRPARTPDTDVPGYAMYSGFEDFPAPEQFSRENLPMARTPALPEGPLLRLRDSSHK